MIEILLTLFLLNWKGGWEHGTDFRVEKTKNFTVMSNHHFKNKNLTLKAKGLLSGKFH